MQRLKELQIQIEHPSPMMDAEPDHGSNGEEPPIKLSAEHPSNGDRVPVTHDGEVVEVKQYINKAVEAPPPAVGLRQDHANASVVVESENRPKAGLSIFSLAVIQNRNPLPRGIPPVISFIAKYGKLPDYIADESHVLVDDDGNYAGYVGRDGKRYNEWNEYESIDMASQRRSHEAMRQVCMAAERRLREKDTPDAEMPNDPPKQRELTRDQKFKMLKSGAFDPEQAEVWSKQTGVPTEVYLVKNDHAREKAYRQWLKEKRDAEIKVCV